MEEKPTKVGMSPPAGEVPVLPGEEGHGGEGYCITQRSVLTADSRGRERLSTGGGGKRPRVLMAMEVCGELVHTGSKDAPRHPCSGTALYTQTRPCTHLHPHTSEETRAPSLPFCTRNAAVWL